MARRGHRSIAAVAAMVLVGACGPDGGESPTTSATPAPTLSEPAVSSPGGPAPVLMPDLVGLPSAVAGRRIGRLEAEADLGITSDWRSIAPRCRARPDTVVRQAPAPGVELGNRSVIRLQFAGLDLAAFRGPCEPVDGDLGPLTGADAALARQFYRFAADPSLGAPFVSGEVWHGIEDGDVSVRIGESERADLEAWELDTAYAEATGPFSALDVVARSGGHYELHRGVRPGCATGDQAPRALAGLRALSLTAPRDTTGSCAQWWRVTLFLDDDGLIAGVALSHGSP